MRLVTDDQRSPFWLKRRVGLITASRIKDVMAYKQKGGEMQSRADYRMQLISGRLTGVTPNNYVSQEMQWGIDNEGMARVAYEMKRDMLVDQVGFVLHPTLDFTGGSPDGLIGVDGGLELKCPNTATHLKWMIAGEFPEEHQAQCLWNMVCCERQWWDFASYDPRLPEECQLFIVRMERVSVEQLVPKFEEEVIRFNAEVEAAISILTKAKMGVTMADAEN